MFGAFIGDIVGSKYEFNNIKTKTQILPVRMAAVLQNGSGSKTRSLTEATETALPCVSHPADWRRLLWMKRWHWLVQVPASAIITRRA